MPDLRAYEREEEAIETAYARGEIDLAELRKQLRELAADYRGQVEEEVERYREDMMGGYY